MRERFAQGFGADNALELRVGEAARIFAARVRELRPSGGKVYLLHDITELRHRERLRHEFIGVLSHELKTPLQSLGTASELLQKRASQADGRWDEDARMLVETIHEDVARIRAVANDFMQVSTVNLQSLRLRLERVPLSELIQEWIKPFKVVARDRGVRLELVLEGSPVIWVRADVVKLPWAISNLIANAIRVSDSGTEVTVLLSDRGPSTQIEVRDEGPGIAPEIQARMFEPYYQAPASGGGASAGFLGLGLTIAKEVVEAHEGRLEYFARRPRGSIFRISLPFGKEI
jgi:signal transduction histidine kinase